MLNIAPSPKLYTAPHGHSSHRQSPRPQANTHSPRLRANKSSTDPTSSHALVNHPTQPPTVSSLSADPQLQFREQGTQYSPPDWPPTDPRSSLRHTNHNPTNPLAPFSSTTANMAPVATDILTHTQKVSQQDAETGGWAGASTRPLAATPSIPFSAATISSPRVRRRRDEVSQSPNRMSTTFDGSSSQDSRTKRARAATSTPQNMVNMRVVPRDYAECDPRLLSALIANMLMELIRYNDELPSNTKLTRFHSRAPPNISVHDYLLRLTHHATLIPPILLAMVFYIDKLCLLYPAFTINSLTVHRFLITAGTVASKGLSDSFWTNNTYARVGGVTVKELALLELEFLERMNWRIVPWQDRILRDYYKNLVQRDKGFMFEERKEGEESSEDDEEEGEEGEGDSQSSHSSDALVDDEEVVRAGGRESGERMVVD